MAGLTEPGAVSLCFLQTGSVRIYGKRRTMNIEGKGVVLQSRLIRFLLGNQVPVYILHSKYAPALLVEKHPDSLQLKATLCGGSTLYQPIPWKYLTLQEEQRISEGWCFQYPPGGILRLVP